MNNTNRVVPVQKIDYLSLIGTMLKIAGVSFAVAESETVLGDFNITGSGAAGNFLVDQPVKTLNFASGVTSATVYFCADYGFDGILVNNAAATISDSGLALAAVKKDAVTLYKAALADSAVTITAVTP